MMICHTVTAQGNTHAKGWQHSDALAHDEFQNSESPVDPPGSPLTYSPQLLMQPHSAGGSPYGSRGSGAAASDCHAVAGWPAQPKLVPTVIVCKSPSISFIHVL
jgi:5'-AMP-activated protein kinase regulatory beta subunit